MSPVHRLGHLDDSVREMARDVPRYREILTRQPESLLQALDEHIVNRVHEGDLPGGAAALASERDAHITLAIRALIDYWPDIAPAGAYARQAGKRTRPPASETGS